MNLAIALLFAAAVVSAAFIFGGLPDRTGLGALAIIGMLVGAIVSAIRSTRRL